MFFFSFEEKRKEYVIWVSFWWAFQVHDFWPTGHRQQQFPFHICAIHTPRRNYNKQTQRRPRATAPFHTSATARYKCTARHAAQLQLQLQLQLRVTH